MAEDLQAGARAALAAIATAIPSAAVTVISHTSDGDQETGTGVRAVTAKASDLSELGELGMTTNLVRVSAGDFTIPERGATIIVGSVKGKVSLARLDPAGATIVIEYTEEQVDQD